MLCTKIFMKCALCLQRLSTFFFSYGMNIYVQKLTICLDFLLSEHGVFSVYRPMFWNYNEFYVKNAAAGIKLTRQIVFLLNGK